MVRVWYHHNQINEMISSNNNNNPPPLTSSPTGGQQQQNDSSGSDGGVKVYKLVNGGELQLLNEDEYDVVSVNSNAADDNNDNDEMKEDAADDIMDVDESKDEKSDNGDNNETTLFIVRPTNYTHQHNRPSNNNHQGQKTDGEMNDNYYYSNNNNVDQQDDEEDIAAIQEASHTASTLARALAQRTDGFDSLRPKYYDFLRGGNTQDNNNNDEDVKKTNDANNQKGDKKGKLSTTSSSIAAAASTSSSPTKSDKSKSVKHDNTNTTSTTASTSASSLLQQERYNKLQSQKLIQTLSNKSTSNNNNNIRDGDTPNTLLQLTQMRIWQERNIDPSMQGMELDNWEDEIDWEGGCDEDDEEEKEGDDKTAITSHRNNDDGDEEKKDDASCTEDYQSYPYKPPIPEGGYPKRQRLPPRYENPVELLYEPRNPRLEALDLISSVDWEGATSDNDDDDDYVNVPLILQSSIAGKSVAPLLAPCPTSRPLPFESTTFYQQRYDREMTSEITSTADIGKNTFERNEALEKYKEARQRKREQMAKDKQSRVTEVMSALSLSGTGRRITSSLMGPGGAERTGRPSRHALGSSSAHDTEYVEQLELVYNHTLVKPDLTLSEYRQFHRPRLPLIVINPGCPWQFQTRVITENKRSSRGVTAADGSIVGSYVGSYHSMMSAGAKAQHKIRNEADLSSSMGDLVVLEYSEERPPLYMTKGMTCRIVNYYRGDRAHCPVSAGGGDRPLRKRHGDKAASATGPTPAGPSNRVERPPRLVGPNQYKMKSAVDLIGILPKKKKKSSTETSSSRDDKKEGSIDVLPEGVTEILHQKVHGPFIGDVEEGKTQTGLISNLFAAAMFRHDTEPTDFLMILGQMREASTIISGTSAPTNSSGGLGVILRSLPANIYTVAQTEPRLKVFSPNSNDEKKVS